MVIGHAVDLECGNFMVLPRKQRTGSNSRHKVGMLLRDKMKATKLGIIWSEEIPPFL